MPVLLACIICWRRFIASCRMWNCSIKKHHFPPLTVLMMHFVCYMITLYNAGLIVWWTMMCFKEHVYFSLLSLRWSFLDYFLNLFEISTLTLVSGGLKKKEKKSGLQVIDQKTECSSLITANVHINNSASFVTWKNQIWNKGATTQLKITFHRWLTWLKV